MVALLRPDSWDFPLFLHMLGAMVLVGAVAATVIASGRGTLLRGVAFRTTIFLVLPSWLLMRIAGQWIDSRESVPDDPAWLGIGYIVGDAGLLVLLVTAGLAWWAYRHPERGWPGRAVAGLASLYLLALLVAMWAMTTKPD
jgi:NADH:ubiquinone oxidoreductase subunit 6 (subunit J)